MENKIIDKIIESPNLNEVSELMKRIWARPEWDYSPSLLRAYLDRPSINNSISLGLFCDNKICGHVAGFPYLIRRGKEQQNLLFGSWWTVDTSVKVYGIALKLKRELFRLARERGFEGFITISKNGSHADKSGLSVYRRLKVPVFKLATFSDIIGSPLRMNRRLKNVTGLPITVYSPKYREGALLALNRVGNNVELSKILMEEEIDFVLKDRPLTKTWIYHRDGKVLGLVNVVTKTLLADVNSDNAFIDNLAMIDMTDDEISGFWKSILADSYWQKIKTIYLPATGYVKESIYRSLGFIKSKDEFNLYYMPFGDKKLDTTEVESFFMDIF